MRRNQTKRLGTPFLLALLLLFLWVGAALWAVSERQRVIQAREVGLTRLNVAVEEQTLRLFKLAELTVVTIAAWIEEHPKSYPGQDPRFISPASRSVSVSASIGVSLYPLDHADPDTLLRHADQAMYAAKRAGKNRYRIFDPASGDRTADQVIEGAQSGF